MLTWNGSLEIANCWFGSWLIKSKLHFWRKKTGFGKTENQNWHQVLTFLVHPDSDARRINFVLMVSLSERSLEGKFSWSEVWLMWSNWSLRKKLIFNTAVNQNSYQLSASFVDGKSDAMIKNLEFFVDIFTSFRVSFEVWKVKIKLVILGKWKFECPLQSILPSLFILFGLLGFQSKKNLSFL